MKCCFNERLYGPKNQWMEPPKAKEKKKERLIYKAPLVKCECGVKSNYGLVPNCECLKDFLFLLPDFKYNIIALLTGCILYMKGLDAARTMP